MANLEKSMPLRPTGVMPFPKNVNPNQSESDAGRITGGKPPAMTNPAPKMKPGASPMRINPPGKMRPKAPMKPGRGRRGRMPRMKAKNIA